MARLAASRIFTLVFAIGVGACSSSVTTSASPPRGEPGPPRATVIHGWASWYGQPHHGRLTASGETFDMHRLTAAHPSLPLGTRLLVTNVANGRAVVVRVNDRGPYRRGRILDLSYAAARALHAVEAGVINVRVALVDR
jgi:rare lipoprotein A